MKTPQKSITIYKTFSEFYPFYLQEHSNGTNRVLHFAGTTCVILLSIYLLLTSSWEYLWLLPVCGYGFAWVGHFFFEKNKPATFKYPAFSLRGDFVMWWQIVTQQIPMNPKN